MLHSVRYLDTTFQGQLIGLTFKGEAVQEEFPEHWGAQLYKVLVI
jgi:hypothetical protein